MNGRQAYKKGRKGASDEDGQVTERHHDKGWWPTRHMNVNGSPHSGTTDTSEVWNTNQTKTEHTNFFHPTFCPFCRSPPRILHRGHPPYPFPPPHRRHHQS